MVGSRAGGSHRPALKVRVAESRWRFIDTCNDAHLLLPLVSPGDTEGSNGNVTALDICGTQ